MLSPAAETVNTPDNAVLELSRETYVYGAFEYRINDDYSAQKLLIGQKTLTAAFIMIIPVRY